MEDDKELPTKTTMNNSQPIEDMEIEHEPIQPKETNDNIHNMAKDDVPASTSSTSKKKTLEGWTKDEKFYLYLGIKYKGSKNLKEIKEHIPTKTLEEIEEAIVHYRDRANQNPECTSRKMKIRRVRSKPLIPLASWAKVLTDNLSYNELQTEMVSALRLIADLDDIPPPEWTGLIDFRKVYHYIADAMEGKSPHETKYIGEVLNSCILETALFSKQFVNVTTFKNIVSSVNLNEKSMAVIPRPTKDCELRIIRHLASQENYNPLGIPEDNLLPMSNDPIIHPK